MRKEILKSKMLLIALTSILFVSCGGGGGGGGGSSNLPINPGTPSRPSTPSTPKLPVIVNEFPISNNPLDKSMGMVALKNKLGANRENINVTIPTDTREIIGNDIKIGILDADFTHKHEYNKDFEIVRPFYFASDVGRASWDNNDSVSPHGEQVLEVLQDRSIIKTSSFFNSPLDYEANSKNKIGIVSASIGIGGTNKNDKRVKPNLEVYRRMLDLYLEDQNVKIFNQSWGAEKTIQDPYFIGKNLRNYVFDEKDTDPYIIPFFEEAVNNKNALFIWAAGNDPTNDVTLEAGLPYFSYKLEKGWIAAIGITPEEMVKNGNEWKKVPNGKLNIHRPGNERLAYAGEKAKWWAISADDRSMFWPTSTGYSYAIGSSFATPRVTRAAALVAEKFPWMTNDQIRQTLFTTTDDTEIDSNIIGEDRRRIKTEPDNKYGWGMLNQERALKGPGAFIATKYSNRRDAFYADVPSGTTSYFENKIFGSGRLKKLGDGTLHLTEDNSFSGGSTVEKGTLVIHKIHSSTIYVDATGKLILQPKAIIGYDTPDNDIIRQFDPQKISESDPNKITIRGLMLTNRGKVEVNGTTAIVGGDYIGYKGSEMIFNNGAKLNILGVIRVQDASMKVMSNEYITVQGERNTLMEGKSFEGNITKVETNGMRKANIEVKDGKLVATLSRQNPVEYVGENAEASTKNVAGNVENVFQDLDRKIKEGTATKEELAMGATIQNMERSVFAITSEMMSGEIYASAQALTFSQAQNINRDLSNRLAGLDNFKNSNKDSEVWFSAIGSGGKLRREGYASADTRVTGGQFGIDTKFEGSTTLGVAMNYSYAKANFNRYAGESKSDMVGVSFYGKQELPYGLYTAGRLGLSNISSKVERELLTSTGETVTGKIKHHDKMLSAYVEVGKKIGWLTPFVGYSQDYLRRGSFNESEASWGVKADSKNYRTSNFLVGVRAEYVGDKYKLQTYVTQAINTDKRDLSYEGSFTGNATKQKFYGVKQAKNTTWIGIGAFRELSPVFGVYGNVDFRVEDRKWADSVISTGLQYRF